jgi:hypothetical protein
MHFAALMPVANKKAALFWAVLLLLYLHQD